MGRVAKKAPEASKAEQQESPIQTITQTRAKRTPKPNPKYANESIIATPKIIESSESNGSTDIELKLPESKIVKSSAKKSDAATNNKPLTNTSKTPITAASAAAAAKGKGAIKKQKIDFEDDEKTKDADEIPLPAAATPRSTRSGKTTIASSDTKDEIKVGNDSIAIVDVSNIILTSNETIVVDEPAKVTRGSAGRKRQAVEVESEPAAAKEESPKKKKEEEKVSLITTRKSYMPATTPVNKKAAVVVPVDDDDDDDIIEEKEEAKKESVDAEKVLANTAIKTRRSGTTQDSPKVETLPEKKAKIEIVKATPAMAKNFPEPKKLPVVAPPQRKEVFTKIISPNPTPGLGPKANNSNNSITVVSNVGRPAPRLLNSMITPKGAKESPNVKLAGDGTDRKVFSIEMSDGSVIEKKAISVSPVKSPSAVAVKENIATINKPQPSQLLTKKLESELSRMKASANVIKRNAVPVQPRNVTAHSNSPASAVGAIAGTRRITKFESWYVIDVKNQETLPTLRHNHTFSLVELSNNITEIQLPSTKWEYKVTTQKRVQRNNNNEEVFAADEPNCILFKRSSAENNRPLIDRSLMFKANMYAITMNGKQCHLLGAPGDVKSLEDIEILLQIVDSCNASHSCVEPNF